MLKKTVAILIIAATFTLFGFYIYSNPETVDTILDLHPLTILGLTAGYTAVVILNSLVLHFSLYFVGHRIKLIENILLTGYSSIVNFFGPLQSGPGVRAVYLKRKHSVSIKDFSVTLVVFYFLFALINGAVLLTAMLIKYSGPAVYITTAIVLLAFAALSSMVIKHNPKAREIINRIKLSDKNLWLISLGAFMLVVITVFIYHLELVHVTSVDVTQTIIYTAAANFSLFVSLTPGAIGFRESFVLLTQQLHGIDTFAIISANIIDRAFYIIFLLAMFVVLIALNSRRRLSIMRYSRKQSDEIT